MEYAERHAALFMYAVAITGNGKYVFATTEAAAVIVPPLVVVVVAVPVPVPMTIAPVVVAVCRATVPVHVAPVGQHLLSVSENSKPKSGFNHAILCALSVVQNDPAVQQAPPSLSAKVEHELKFEGQLPSRFNSSCSSGINVIFEIRDSSCGS